MATIKQLQKRLGAVTDNVRREIAQLRGDGSIYARGTASEGYAGGYLDALQDVLLATNDVEPGRAYWRGESR